MDKSITLEAAIEQGYIIGSDSTIESLQEQFYKWCGDNLKPYITISTKTKYSHFSVDTPSTKLRLNENGISAIRNVMEQHIVTKGTYSIGKEVVFHDKVPIEVAEKLANEIVKIFNNKDNLETKI